jgi:hypothetical protein
MGLVALLALVVPCVLAFGLLGSARADGGALWRYAPALAPPPPSGVTPAPYPVPLGAVGQISFWAPNRGLLITGGTASEGGPVASGLYVYDGVSWHQLSTVCGGGDGRIAWAGPDEFWTIADQRPGQLKARQQSTLASLSLCHFLNGAVVASYAMPLEKPDSYLEMDAAACFSSNDCWFGGKSGNGGSFHLHWDGAEVTTVDDSVDHAVTGMANFQDRLYEGLAIGPEDASSQNQPHPAVIRTIAPTGLLPSCNGAPSTFCDVFLFSLAANQALPMYPSGVSPDGLSGFEIATDGSPLGAGATQLWAGADPANFGARSLAPVTILQDTHEGWTQVVPAADGSSSLPAGAYLSGSETDQQTSQKAPNGEAIAPEPGTGGAWLSLVEGGGGDSAQVALLEGNGKLAESDTLPGLKDPVGARGNAGPIACPAVHDCWMATIRSGQASGGWLFHLTDGSQFPQDTDPNFAGVISYRPPDAGVPVIYPDVPPVDDSLANQQPPPALTGPPEQAPAPPVKYKKRRPLVLHVKSRFLHGRVLVISFTLTARAHVQLVGRRSSKIVARTRNESLRPGPHRLSLSLDPVHWPTKLQFKATPIGASAPAGGEAGGSGSDNTVSTG